MLDDLLNRPLDQRIKEYRYRCAQAVVFGLPVAALEIFGPALDRNGHERWVPPLQALLAGWVCYVGAMGMLFESILMLGMKRISADLVPSLFAVGCFLWSALSTIGVLVQGHPFYQPLLFAACVVAI